MRRDRSAHPPALTPGYKTSVLRSPRSALLSIEPGPLELSRPAFGVSDIGPLDHNLVRNYAAAHGLDGEAQGPRIVVHGRVTDQNGRPVPNSLIEIWQANAGGKYRHTKDGYRAPLDPHFGGCGRCVTDDDGAYAFFTIQPGPYPWPNHGSDWRPAHIHLSLFGTAFAQRLVTQLYFEGDPLIPLCPIANTVGDTEAVDRMTAMLDMAHQGPFDHLTYRFDMVLRGRRQTFFETRPEGM